MSSNDFLMTSGLFDSSVSRLLKLFTAIGSGGCFRYMHSVCATNDYPNTNGRIGINGSRRRVPTVTVVEASSTSKSNPDAYTTAKMAGGIRDSKKSTWVGIIDRVEMRMIGSESRGIIS